MCGHVGIISRSVFKSHLTFFQEALYADALRGEDGTGIAFLDKEFNARIMKKAMGARDFIDMKSYNKIIGDNGFKSKFIMGHNRWATKGGVSNKTSHPFHYKDILMAHNGSLRGQWRLPESRDFDVDSENIAYSLAKIGVDKTISLLDGSYSLVWANTTDKTVNFIRNHERPMYMGLVKDKKTVLYASEELMIEWLADRNNIVLDSIAHTEVDTLYTFDMSPEKDKEVLLPKARGIEGYRFPVVPKKPVHLKAVGNKKETQKIAEFQDKRDVMLKLLGLTKGDRLEFDVSAFDRYASPMGTQRGVLQGYLTEDPWCDVKIYGFNNSEMKIKPGDSLSSSVLSVIVPKKKDKFESDTLVLSADSVEPCITFEDLGLDGITDVHAEVYEGPNEKVNYKEWSFLTKFGCSECSDNLYHRDHEDITWVNRFSPICKECSGKANAHVH